MIEILRRRMLPWAIDLEDDVEGDSPAGATSAVGAVGAAGATDTDCC